MLDFGRRWVPFVQCDLRRTGNQKLAVRPGVPDETLLCLYHHVQAGGLDYDSETCCCGYYSSRRKEKIVGGI